MQFAVRALSLLLIVWLTAAASFPPCCWSMAIAHDQVPEQASAPLDQPHQHHHGSGDVVAPSPDAPLISAIPARCESESVEALVTPRTPLSVAGLLAACATPADVLTPPASARSSERRYAAAPSISPGSAFLNPLRI
jgi:hypothetical protein